MKSKVHDIHPNGLRFWEDLNPAWQNPDVVIGFAKVAVASGLTIDSCQVAINSTLTTDQEWFQFIAGINPFTELIPTNLQPEFETLSAQIVKRGQLITNEKNGSFVFHGHALSFYGRKLSDDK